ncbi:hypothetical protein SDRG_16896 [Saprolegnia diclina VS20]|uniref:Kinesin motor domain-containing protein n=1 Tax=Saprolegnia diclina (strain VS20) TaxID=1156394 RepID=T0PW21_SAPDV|nr:hypothetical protein SDRG_16896 [Saprolegnia diclina VS20]EQC25225.1 hypothetical protein SDRG_16896 [Saprolegnia diclina VS20]|eukprot:XP_008621342.1 hypothetical protein SDRG_16896 [Saprolegnia diclina VS20]
MDESRRPFVVVRVQPPQDEAEKGLGVVGNGVTWIHHAEEREFRFGDVVAPAALPDVLTERVINTLRQGRHATVLSLGQRESGKTTALLDADVGLVHHVARSLFALDVTVRMSFLDVYADKAMDMLKGKSTKCRPLYHRSIGAYASDLTRLQVSSYDAFEKTLAQALRALAIDCIVENRVHGVSCRILSLYIEHPPHGLWTRLDFVDMPASAPRHHTQAETDLGHIMEQGYRQLHVCWKQLADGDDPATIPYGLTATSMLLQHMLGSMADAFVIANVVQSALQNEENLLTLRHATLLQAIPSRVPSTPSTICSLLGDMDEDLLALRDRITWLKAKLQLNDAGPAASAALEQELQAKRQATRHIESLRADFHKEAIEYHQDALKFQCGVESLSISLGTSLLEHDSLNVYLVRLHEERLFSSWFRFNIAANDVLAGRLASSQTPPDKYPGIVLFGGGAMVRHCRFQMPTPPNVELLPDEGICLLNGADVSERTTLRHGDALTLGRRNVFRVFIPRVHALEPLDLSHFYNRESVVRAYATTMDLGPGCAERHCHDALTRIVDRIVTIRAMHRDGMRSGDVPDSEAMDIHDIYLQKGAALDASAMTTEMRLATIRRLSQSAIDEMNILENRIATGYAMPLLDYVDEANVMSKEVNEPLIVRAVPIIQHMVTHDDEAPIDRAQLQTDLWIVFQNRERPRQRMIMRPQDFFLRLALLRSYHSEVQLLHSSKARNPFVVDDGVEELIGVAPVYMGRLAYYLDVDEAVPIVNRTGSITGHLVVSVQPYVEEKVYDAVARREVVRYTHFADMDIDKDNELATAVGMQTHVEFHVTVRGARGLPSALNSNVFVEYSFFDDERPRATEPSPTKSSHPVIQETFVHRVLVTDKLVHYLLHGAVTFQVYGYRGDHIHLRDAPDRAYWCDLETKSLSATIHALERKVDGLQTQLRLAQTWSDVPSPADASSILHEAKVTVEDTMTEEAPPTNGAKGTSEEDRDRTRLAHATSWRGSISKRTSVVGRVLRAKSISSVLSAQRSGVCAVQ